MRIHQNQPIFSVQSLAKPQALKEALTYKESGAPLFLRVKNSFTRLLTTRHTLTSQETLLPVFNVFPYQTVCSLGSPHFKGKLTDHHSLVCRCNILPTPEYLKDIAEVLFMYIGSHCHRIATWHY